MIEQSGGGGTATNLGIGAIGAAVMMLETGANVTVSLVWTGWPPPNGGSPKTAGIGAFSLVDGFASTPSWVAVAEPWVNVSGLSASKVTVAVPGGPGM